MQLLRRSFSFSWPAHRVTTEPKLFRMPCVHRWAKADNARNSPNARRVAPPAVRGLDGESASRATIISRDAGRSPSDWKPHDHTTTKSETRHCERLRS